jgi:predicted transcriptional regulator of viral defense system
MTHKGSKNSKWRLIANLDEKILGDLEWLDHKKLTP